MAKFWKSEFCFENPNEKNSDASEKYTKFIKTDTKIAQQKKGLCRLFAKFHHEYTFFLALLFPTRNVQPQTKNYLAVACLLLPEIFSVSEANEKNSSLNSLQNL